MKRNFTTILSVGAALFALFAFTSASRASFMLDNITGQTFTAGTTASNYKSQGFEATENGLISSVSLELTFSAGTVGSLSVYLVTANASGQPSEAYTAGTLLGTISTTLGTDGTASAFAVNLTGSASLINTVNYAIVINGSDLGLSGTGHPSWDYLHSGALPGGITGTFDGAYSGNGTTFSTANAGEERGLQIGVSPVPEVPMTGAFMGFGALVIVGGSALRRKLAAAKTA